MMLLRSLWQIVLKGFMLRKAERKLFRLNTKKQQLIENWMKIKEVNTV